MKAAVIGAGSWGTALAQLLAHNNNDVTLWARKKEVVDTINTSHFNPRYLSEQVLSSRITASSCYADVIQDVQVVVVVTPSNLLRDVARRLKTETAFCCGGEVPLIVCSKGVEEYTGLLPLEVMEQELGNGGRFAVLSGPNHAEEVICGVPTATVIASSSVCTAEFFQKLFATDSFRTYTSHDVIGVELCAAFKNVIAIAVGISYGLGYGDNTAALLLTRGSAEMSRLVVAAGGEAITCMGLAGTGDLVATCMSRHSRNRQLGEMLAAGKTLDDFTCETHMVAEGALACKTLEVLEAAYNVELPITDVVRSVIWGQVSPRDAAALLTKRPLKAEFYGIGRSE